MAFFLLLPGSGGSPFYWHAVLPILEKAGHEAVAVDFPGDSPDAGLPEYAALAIEAAKGKKDVIVAAQSMGGFSAPRVAAAVDAKAIILINAMIPEPGEVTRAWGEHVGSAAARRERAEREGYAVEVDLDTYFLHDVAPDVAAKMKATDRKEADIAYSQPAVFDAWPSVPIHVLIGADDRLFPADFQRRVAEERLGPRATSIAIIPGGHLVGLSQPSVVAAKLLELAP